MIKSTKLFLEEIAMYSGLALEQVLELESKLFIIIQAIRIVENG